MKQTFSSTSDDHNNTRFSPVLTWFSAVCNPPSPLPQTESENQSVEAMLYLFVIVTQHYQMDLVNACTYV